MRLLKVTLDGEYKGLANQSFNFSGSQGNILALIGLNGSGKSQLLELIAESFAYLERKQRTDFKVRGHLPYSVTLEYQIQFFDYELEGAQRYQIEIDRRGRVHCKAYVDDDWHSRDEFYTPLPSHVIGYSSGLNENLQRSFMKNAVQFYDVMNIRQKRRKELAQQINEAQVIEINRRYLARHPQIFEPVNPEALVLDNLLAINETDTLLPRMIFMDYDSSALLLAAVSILPDTEINQLFNEIKYRLPRFIKLRYDIRGGVAEEDAIRDIQLLSRIGSSEGVGRRATPAQYELYGLDFLSGIITLDLSSTNIKAQLYEANYGSPLTLFQRLYKLQLLGVKNWQVDDIKKLRKDGFLETVKKPLKTKLPLSVVELKLANKDDEYVDFDDLSDGESQLIQVLAAARVFRDEFALFIFDEPETHLNPSWRTYFHKHLAGALEAPNGNKNQVLLSTHSPFMISSLHRSDVYCFERAQNGQIQMSPPVGETYGASFDVIIKQYFNLRSLISQTVVEEIKSHLPQADNNANTNASAREWIESTLGDSMEKAYLLRKLQD